MINQVKRSIYGLPLLRPYRLFRAWQISKNPRLAPEGLFIASFDAMFQENWERVERACISEQLSIADVFIDVGAITGFYTCLAAHRGKDVVAIEPDEGNQIILQENIRRMGCERSADNFHGIASDVEGHTVLYGDGDMASIYSEWQGVKGYFRQCVNSTTLDMLIGERFNNKRLLIKIDVEGAELSVLNGAAKVLKRVPRPILMIETFPKLPTGKENPTHQAVLKLLEESGYAIRALTNHNYICS